jgi:DNA-binding NtrC family response regulator
MALYTTGRQADDYWTGRFDFPPSDGGLSDEDVAMAARGGAPVLLTGPAELTLVVARRIHDVSARREGPFTVVDCGGPGPTVVESLVEAFGDPLSTPLPAPTTVGTMYMKNVGALSPVAQRLVAGLLAHPGRSRVIASTPRPLFDRVAGGEFDESLFYRLNVMQFSIE